ncbi:chemotaxis protein CheW [Vreelandella subglaciescola]|jgi:two-component system chemotaxis sensor kinase CheA|uniref:Chemotaxis protein CheA n=1 Tax=Vreelandella subglaciescola TaxID=29571 RepID=A0A1M7HGM3_9GAMM|nr:chemotaxis protein CheW [Halomonas subglaciescola]SHM27632.1 CheA signal transduction histidine kinase [Halomonas subglaciescola]
MDITDFYDTFFEEAEELLADMEQHLLDLDVDDPDSEQLNAIFRAAHSIKGGAGTFGFSVLQKTTHIFENLLDYARKGELALRTDLVDTFLEAKDIMHEQLNAYRSEAEPDHDTFERICRTLQQIAVDEMGMELDAGGAPAASAPPQAEPEPAASADDHGSSATLQVVLLGVGDKDRMPLVEELEQLGDVLAQSGDDTRYEVTLGTTASADDIEAVMCFIIEPEQIEITSSAAPETSAQALRVLLLGVDEHDRTLLVEELEQLGSVLEQSGDDARYEIVLSGSTSADDIEAVMCFIIEPGQIEITSAASSADDTPPPAPAPPEPEPQSAQPEPTAAPKEAPTKEAPAKKTKPKKKAAAESSIRVSVDKVDQVINLVGELIITQSMLDQTVSDLDDQSVGNSALQNGMSLLQRNARDLQESVMSIRMIPMEFVFSRFPRVVRDTASKLNKDIELVTEGKSTELDKSLVERITDPLTHLVRNSLDHGIEMPDVREAVGKPRTGKLTLAARHQGGNILIEVKDDGAGMDRDVLLKKARENGLNVSDTMADEDVWQLIFSPGFSTAKEVTDVSGRGVGMDVVKRNIQGMGGRVEIQSKKGEGTNTRVVLPLTLAILDGMSIKVGAETFILPLTAVLESLQPTKEDMYAMAGDDVVLKVRDEYLPVIAIHEVLDVQGAITDPTKSIAVIVQGEGHRYAMLVDELIGQQQVVVKNLEDNYRKVPGVSAATILGDGSVSLILDITALHRLNRDQKEAGKIANHPTPVLSKEAEPS